MYKKNKILALIIARKNSTRLKNKNLQKIKGRRCVEWTFIASKKSKYIDKVFLSTDSKEIINIAKKYNIDVPFIRPKLISKRHTSVKNVINHFINKVGFKNLKSTYLILLQSTSPNRSEKNIDEAIEKFFKNKKFKSDTLVSVKKMNHKYWWLKQSYGDLIKSVFKKKDTGLKNFLFIPNGAIYISALKKNINFYGKRTLYYIMDSYSSIDIDLKQDLYKARIAKRKY